MSSHRSEEYSQNSELLVSEIYMKNIYLSFNSLFDGIKSVMRRSTPIITPSSNSDMLWKNYLHKHAKPKR